MPTLLNRIGTPRGLEFAAPTNEEARAQVWTLLSGMYPTGMQAERRRDQRYPYPRLFVLSPVNPDSLQRIGPSVTAAGKHLSESGISFYHPAPLPHRWVIASVEHGDGKAVRFLVDLDWCRFTRQGWYESGGRLLRTVN